MNFLTNKKNEFFILCFKFTLLFVLLLSAITCSITTFYGENANLNLNYTKAPIATIPFSGSGTEDDPYLIKKESDLVQLSLLLSNAQPVTFSGKYLKLTSNIYMSSSFTPIGESYTNSFRGTFDGGNHIIQNLTISSGNDFVGLFGYVSGATIKNLIISGTVESTNSSNYAVYVGGFAGCIGDNSSFINCSNWCNVSYNGTSTISYVGGIAGFGSLKAELCRNLGDITNTGTSSGNKYTGGICGYMSSANTITKCFNSGNVASGNSIATKACAGGICGYGDTISISYCYNTGTINAAAAKTTDVLSDYDLKTERPVSCGGRFYYQYYTGWLSANNTAYAYGIAYGKKLDINNCYNISQLSGGYLYIVDTVQLYIQKTATLFTSGGATRIFFYRRFSMPTYGPICNSGEENEAKKCSYASSGSFERGYSYLVDMDKTLFSDIDWRKATTLLEGRSHNKTVDAYSDIDLIISKSGENLDITLELENTDKEKTYSLTKLSTVPDEYSNYSTMAYTFSKNYTSDFSSEPWSSTKSEAINDGWPYLKDMYW